MLRFVSLCFGTVVRLLRARRSLLIENLALRQQLTAIKRRHPRSQLGRLDKAVLDCHTSVLVTVEKSPHGRHA
jgi:hypothetical protein